MGTGEGGDTVQRAPGSLGQGVRVALAGQWRDRFREFAEGGLQLAGCLGPAEWQLGVEREHGVVESRMLYGEADIGRGEFSERGHRGAAGLPRVSQDEAQFSESLDGDRLDNVRFADEVAVENRLTVFDSVGQPTGSDGVPALGFRQLAGGRDDGPAPVGPVALSALSDGHGATIASLDVLATLDRSWLGMLASLEEKGASPMTTDHQQLAERYLAMLNQHDPDAVEGFVAVGYINHNPFVEDGREANRTFWAAFFTAFPDLTAAMDDLIQAGDRVAGRFTYRATHRGPFYGIPPTGRRIEMRSIDIWRVHNGEFAEHWDELNLLEVFQQLGVIPALDLGAQETTS